MAATPRTAHSEEAHGGRERAEAMQMIDDGAPRSTKICAERLTCRWRGPGDAEVHGC